MAPTTTTSLYSDDASSSRPNPKLPDDISTHSSFLSLEPRSLPLRSRNGLAVSEQNSTVPTYPPSSFNSAQSTFTIPSSTYYGIRDSTTLVGDSSSGPNSPSRTFSPAINSPAQGSRKRMLKKRPGTPGGPGLTRTLGNNFTNEVLPALPTRAPSGATMSAEMSAPFIPAREITTSFSSIASNTFYPSLPPGLGSSTPPSTSSGSQPSRKPSLSSPSPPTSLPDAVQPLRSALAPLNLTGLSSSQSHPYLSRNLAASHPSPALSNHISTSPQGSPSQASPSYSSSSPQTQDQPDRSQTRSISNAGSSTLPDSPNTRVMMRRLLSKPAPASPVYVSSSDNESAVLYSRRNVSSVEERVQGRRERSKIKEVLGSVTSEEVTPKPPFAPLKIINPELDFGSEVGADVDVDSENESPIAFESPMGDTVPWLESDAGFLRMRDEGKEMEWEHLVGKLDHQTEICGHWPAVASTMRKGAVSSVEEDAYHSSHDTGGSSNEKDARKQKGPISLIRRRTTNNTSRIAQSPLPPLSSSFCSATSGNIAPRVHALDALSPIITVTVKRSYSASIPSPQLHDCHIPHNAAPKPLPVHYNHNPRSSSLHPRDRIRDSGRRFNNSSRETSRTPSPNVSTLSAHSGQGRGITIDPASLSPSASAHSSSKLPSPLTPASALVEEYKRQQRIKQEQELALKQTKRMSAVMWAQEQANLGLGKESSPTRSVRAKENGSSPVLMDIGSASVNSSESGLSHVSPRSNERRHSRALGSGFEMFERMFGKEKEKDGRVGGEEAPVSQQVPHSPLNQSQSPQTYHSREDLPVCASKLTPLRRTKTSPDELAEKTKEVLPLEKIFEPESACSPYYTVFGSTSDRVVPAGSAQDCRDTYGLGYWDSEVMNRRSVVAGNTRKNKGGFTMGLKRTLSRKVSDRWKKSAGGVASATDDEEALEDKFRGRTSMQDARQARRVASAETREMIKNRRSIRLSIDKFMDDDTRAELTGLSLLRKKTQDSNKSPTTPADDLSQQKKNGGIVKGKTDAIGGGGRKLWKFVKRIRSAGVLRDNYHDGRPPVPALPANVSHSNDSLLINGQARRSFRNSLTSAAVNGSQVLAQMPSPSTRRSIGDDSSSPSRPNTSNNTPVSTSAPASSSALEAQTSPQTRHIVNTRSSSPLSSDHASLKFFNRTHSRWSSTSSLGEEIPPLPQAPATLLGQSIISTSEFYRSQEQVEGGGKVLEGRSSRTKKQHPPSSYQKKTMEDDWFVVRAASNELTSLPAPPRRPQSLTSMVISDEAMFKPDPDDLDEFDESESPIIPEFSVDNVINAFPARKPPAAAATRISKRVPDPPIPPFSSPSTGSVTVPTAPSITSLPPPPRPPRNNRRPTPPTKLKVFELSSPSIPSSDSNLLERPITSSFGCHHPLSTTSQNANTLTPDLPSTSTSSRSSSTTLSQGSPGTVTFREMTSVEKYVLTDKEKADKWDALLEKSARAGGTLHLAGGGDDGLESDRLRFSEVLES